MSNIMENQPTVMAHLVLKDVDKTIAFYKQAFGAVELCRLDVPGTNQLMHASMQIGNSMIMLMQESDQCQAKSPIALGGSPVTIHLNVTNADDTYKVAVAAGAEAVMPVEEMFWGDRYGVLKDPSGHTWSISHKVKTLTPEQIEENMKQFCGAGVS